MKSKILTVAIFAIALYSCGGSKSAAPKVETKTVVVNSDITEGKSLYENNCAKCHKLYAPSDFSKEEWKPVVLRMQKKAHLEDADGQKIYNYLTANL